MAILPGFRASIAAVAVALSLVTLGAAFWTISFVVNRSQERQFDGALLMVADEEAADLSAHPDEQVSISDRPGPSANEVGPLPLFGALYAPDGSVISRTPTFGDAAPGAELLGRRDRAIFDFVWRGEVLRGVLVPVPGRSTRLLVAASRADLDSDGAFLRRAMLLVFCVAVAWTAAFAWGIATRMTRTHRAIVDTAQRVSAGDLSARVHPGAGRDEVSGLARNIDEMIERLVLLLGRQQQFIAHAAHELRSPLASLYGELSNALRRSRDAETYRAAIEQALRATRRLNGLADDLLTLARLGARMPERAQRVGVISVIEHALDEVRGQMEDRKITVSLHGEQVEVAGRPSDLARMFRNLIENAVRYSPEGGAVSVRSAREADHVIVEVSDHGPGVSPEHRETIFLPFVRDVRDSPQRRSVGAGLGLAIARDIARLHAGDLTLGESSEGGARFIVRLPALADGGSPEGGLPDQRS